MKLFTTLDLLVLGILKICFKIIHLGYVYSKSNTMQFETVLTNHLTEAFLIHPNKTLYDMSCTLSLTLFFHRVIKKVPNPSVFVL